MIVQTQNTSAAQGPAPSAADPARQAVETFSATGRLDAAALLSAEPGAVANAAGALPPLQQGQFQVALLGAGLGDLLGGTVGGALETVDNTADAAVTTPSERQAEQAEQARQADVLTDLRDQAELERVLAPYEKLDRPPAALAHAVEVVSPKDGDPDRRDPLRED